MAARETVWSLGVCARLGIVTRAVMIAVMIAVKVLAALWGNCLRCCTRGGRKSQRRRRKRLGLIATGAWRGVGVKSGTTKMSVCM